MKKFWTLNTTLMLLLILTACASAQTHTHGNTPLVALTPLPATAALPLVSAPNKVGAADANNPCLGLVAPAHWKHIVVLMFENQTYDQVIGPAPYITSLAHQCATAPDWLDANTKVDGSADGHYNSKPNYATLMSGLPPSAHGLLKDIYATTTTADTIYHQLSTAGLSFKDYYEAKPGGCTVRFEGDRHDPLRYFTDLQTICSEHDVPLATFMTDVNSGNLPVFSILLPNNQHNMHDNNISSGDAYARSILEPLLNSPVYAEGDTAIFFLWDENAPIPNVLIAPSITPGTTIRAQGGNPISHFSALRTWEEMLSLPLLGDTKAAPSLLAYFGNK